MAFAAVYDRWKSPTDEVIESFAIATCEPNEMMVRIHDRMPVILDETQWVEWLAPEPSLDRVQELMAPYPAELMRMQKVSKRVGNSRNEGPDLIEPLTE